MLFTTVHLQTTNENTQASSLKHSKIPIEFLEGDKINQMKNGRTMGMAPEPFDVDPIFVVSDELLKRIAGRYPELHSRAGMATRGCW